MSAFQWSPDPGPAAARCGWCLVVWAGCLGGLAGCRSADSIQSEYGQRVGDSSGRSVNGTSVLASMFEQAGVRVRGARRLGRLIDRAEVVVWFPDRFRPPDEEVRERLEAWLRDRGGRTLVYVGRDYDAAVTYWQRDLELVPPGQRREIRKRLALQRAAHATLRSQLPAEEDCDWFALDRNPPERSIATLEGPWSDGIDAGATRLRLFTRYQPAAITRPDSEPRGGGEVPQMESLLSSEDDLLVGRFTRPPWRGSQILVVANGSWLLNLPLVNREHRKLAGRLLRECGSAKNVVFLESGPGELPLADNQPNRHHGLEAFTVWPVNCILMHLTVLGMILCFSVFPIFGPPRQLEEAERSDFGNHIRALGSLLARTEDRQFARQRRDEYQQRVAHDSGPRVSVVAVDGTSPADPQDLTKSKTE